MCKLLWALTELINQVVEQVNGEQFKKLSNIRIGRLTVASAHCHRGPIWDGWAVGANEEQLNAGIKKESW